MNAILLFSHISGIRDYYLIKTRLRFSSIIREPMDCPQDSTRRTWFSITASTAFPVGESACRIISFISRLMQTARIGKPY